MIKIKNVDIEQSLNNSSTVKAETESLAKRRKPPVGELMFKCQNKDLGPFIVRVYKTKRSWIDFKRRHDTYLNLNLRMDRFDANNEMLKKAWYVAMCKYLNAAFGIDSEDPTAWAGGAVTIVDTVWSEGLKRNVSWSELEGLS